MRHGLSLRERIEHYVVDVGESKCWPWKGKTDGAGYASFAGSYAHRIMFELTYGPIPKGMTIDHLCNNPPCINPSHLAIATQKENILRGDGLGALNARKTHCKRGHEFTQENTYRKPGRQNERNCRTCRKYDPDLYKRNKK